MKIFIIVMISYYEFNKLHMEYLLIIRVLVWNINTLVLQWYYE